MSSNHNDWECAPGNHSNRPPDHHGFHVGGKAKLKLSSTHNDTMSIMQLSDIMEDTEEEQPHQVDPIHLSDTDGEDLPDAAR